VRDPGLRGRVALVTGANHGIGEAIARGLADEGCAVAIGYLRDVPPERYPDDYRRAHARSGDAVAEAILDSGGRAIALEQDLADADVLPLLFVQAEEALGPIEILVNNADHCRLDTFLPGTDTVTAEGLDRHFAVNARAPALLMAELARRATELGSGWGRVVNISTDASAGAPNEISYWATKHALESLTRSAALELAPLGITVNTVCPGPTQTGWISTELEARVLPEMPLGRLGTPEDVADVVVFLCSEQARWLTAQTLYAGGGHRLS
jgi:3-oxoacyl-[acyl-carrier protein] reductase